MRGFIQHFLISLRLNFRNIQALVMGYFVPLFFMVAFRGFYPSLPPLLHEFGMLLVISTLGGACFGLPVSFVAERDRGVWRRYKLAPIATFWFVLSLMLSRFVMLLSAALLLLAGCMFIYGMPMPARPLELLAAYSVVSISFMALGLVIAMVANSPGAVQAIGQCIFMPMIILGGVGVKVEALRGSMRQIPTYLPGLYAVRVLNACIEPKGAGIATPESLFDLAVLGVMCAMCCLLAVKLFRWENDQKTRFAEKLWALVAIVVWIGAKLIRQQMRMH